MEEFSAATLHSPLPPFVMPSRANSPSAWAERVWEDLQPTPGRLGATFRLVLATVMTLLAVLILQVPYGAVALYFVFFVGRESPAVSLRSLFMMVPILAAVATEFGIVILTDNDPMARVLAVAAVSFFAGILTVATTQPALGSTWAFLFVTLIAYWETHAPASHLVTISLWVISALSIPILSSIAVEYVFGARHPAAQLCEQIGIRWRALTEMFTLFGEQASTEKRAEAATRVSRLAATGQEGMQGLYNKIVERNLDTGALMIGARVRITMLAQLMDLAAALGSAPYADDTASLLRYQRIASEAQHAFQCSGESQPAPHEFPMSPHPTLLDRIEALLHSIRSMPASGQATGLASRAPEDKQLVAIPAKKLSLLVPGGFSNPANIAFSLKLSLCATICYILYHVIDYPGISTCVITVFITGLTTTGAIKQKFAFRLSGSMLGGLLGLGAAAFLFPSMDSITSLAILVSILAFIAGWAAQGRRFSYVGMQIAFSFYLVAFEGFSAPTHLAPPRDRLVCILLALLVMWIVFDQIWPVRTLSIMRRSFAALLHDGASLFRLPATQGDNAPEETEALRDRVGRTVAALRVMNEAIEYEFGVDRETHIQSSQAILRAALTAVAMFWNQVVLLHHRLGRELLNDPQIAELRYELAATMDAMADSVAQAKPFVALQDPQPAGTDQFPDPRYNEYATNALTRLRELRNSVGSIDSL